MNIAKIMVLTKGTTSNKMNYSDLPIKKYIMFAAILLIIAIAIITLYYFLGYGTVSIDRKDAYLKIDNTVYDINKDNIRLRPGKYFVQSANAEYSTDETITVFPLKHYVISLKKTDYIKVIKDSMLSGNSYKISKVKLLEKKWLVGVSQNEESYIINILRFYNGQWIKIKLYSPTYESSMPSDDISLSIPPYVYDYVKEISK